jgi:predicted enzyme related to lactoylglutathione lyase
MKSIPLLRLAPILAGISLLAPALAPSVQAAKFPPLNDPTSSGHLPGKLVWADLFTTDPDGATKFYTSLLGWTATPIEQKGKGYVIFSNGGRPVAGLAPRSVKGGNHPSRWIGYYSVADIDATLAAATKDGGIVRAAAHKFPDRGIQAIVADVDGNPIGLLQSSTGDAPDTEPKPGDWNWFELYSKSPKATSDFYHAAIGLDVAPETNSDRKSDFVLSSSGQARGGVAPVPDGADVKPSWLGVIRVANLDDTLAKVAGLGGEVLVAPHSVEYGSRFAIILDSTGGTVGLVQYVDNANPANNP